MNELKILSEDDNEAVVGGYGVLFGGVDLEGETFTKDTDYMLDLVPNKLVFVDHTLDFQIERDGKVFEVKGIDENVGSIIKVTPDDTGLYMELMFQKADQYWDIVSSMLKSKRAGLSSGTIGHLARRVDGVIKRWPIVETSITVNPAEPRTIDTVTRLKILAEANPDLKGVILEVDGLKAAKDTATAPATDAPTAKEAKPLNKIGDYDMSEKEKDKEKAPDNTEVLGQILTNLEELGDAQKAFGGRLDELEQTPTNDPGPAKSVNYNSKTKLGDDETKAWAHWVRTGDGGGIDHLNAAKASNDTTMNITTDADGGYAVPTGHYQGIIARRDESMITNRLGVRNIPGVGTTVNVPVDNEADGEFVSTAESNAYDRDAPALSVVQMTLAKYTKKVDLTVELLNDEDSRLLAFLNDFVGRGMAKTHNSLLLTEVAANGTSLKTFASATVIAVDELETIVFNDDLGPYLDDTNSVGWVMRRSTHGEIATLDDANIRRYYDNQTGAMDELFGFPIVNSQKAGLTAASAKSVYFGNWNFVGYREAPGFTVIRDPYSRAGYGEVIFHYMFRACYDVLQAEAIGYGVHPSA